MLSVVLLHVYCQNDAVLLRMMRYMTLQYLASRDQIRHTDAAARMKPKNEAGLLKVEDALLFS